MAPIPIPNPKLNAQQNPKKSFIEETDKQIGKESNPKETSSKKKPEP
jgi:hypothetical protein